jgi:hypothetical protein
MTATEVDEQFVIIVKACFTLCASIFSITTYS